MWVHLSILTLLRILVTPLVFQTCLKAQHLIDVLRLTVKIVSINEHTSSGSETNCSLRSA